MILSRSGYLIREGFRSIKKHGFMSFASVTIIMACLIIMGSVTLLSVNINALIKDLEGQNEVVAFVDDSIEDVNEALALEGSIFAVDNVQSVEFVPRETAMEAFMSKYERSLMEGIDASVFRHRFVIHLNDISRMGETKAALEGVPGIAKVNAHLEYASAFITIRNIVSAVSLVLTVILVFVSIFIMSNTIKLTTFGRREEIAIMKMVGATNGFIRLPFVVEGLVLPGARRAGRRARVPGRVGLLQPDRRPRGGRPRRQPPDREPDPPDPVHAARAAGAGRIRGHRHLRRRLRRRQRDPELSEGLVLSFKF